MKAIGILFLLCVLAATLLLMSGRVQIPMKATSVDLSSIEKSGSSFISSLSSHNPLALAASGGESVEGPPTVTAAFINRILDVYGSPARGTGQALYDYGVEYGIDPAYALAFFMHESTFGKTGVARATLSLGNIRCSEGYTCIEGFRAYATYQEGYKDYYQLIRNLYISQWHLTTVEQIIPVYAPSSDHNDVAAYIAAINNAVRSWRNEVQS